MDRIQQALHEYHDRYDELGDRMTAAYQKIGFMSEVTRTGLPLFPEQDFIDALSECIYSVADTAIVMHGALGARIALPGIKVGYLYIGTSEALGRVKVGITSNPAKREQSIRRAMKNLGFPGDFEMFEPTAGEMSLVRRAESDGLRLLTDLRVGGEWFRHDGRIWDWHCEAGTMLLDELAEAVRTLDVEAQVNARAPWVGLEGAFVGLPTNETQARLSQLLRLWKQWTAAINELMGIRAQRWGK